MNWRKSSWCGESACLEAARDGVTGVVLLRNSTHSEISPKTFTASEWEDLLDVVDFSAQGSLNTGGNHLAWAYAAFPMVTGIPATWDEFQIFASAVSEGQFEFAKLPYIDRD